MTSIGCIFLLLDISICYYFSILFFACIISMNVQIISLLFSANKEKPESSLDNTIIFDIPVKAILNILLTGSVKFLQCWIFWWPSLHLSHYIHIFCLYLHNHGNNWWLHLFSYLFSGYHNQGKCYTITLMAKRLFLDMTPIQKLLICLRSNIYFIS